MTKKYVAFTYTTKSSAACCVRGDEVGSYVPEREPNPLAWALKDCAAKVGKSVSEFEHVIEGVRVDEEDATLPDAWSTRPFFDDDRGPSDLLVPRAA